MRRSMAARLGIALRAIGAAVRALAWSGAGGQGSPWYFNQLGTLPGTQVDYQSLAGDPELNAVASICLGWIADNIVEPRFQVLEQNAAGLVEPMPRHALWRLLRLPNPHYDGDALLMATAVSYSAHGNAYWWKGRDAAGTVRELWYLPHWQVTPLYPSDGSRFQTGWLYQVGGRRLELRLEDVVHFRFGIDPVNQRLGVSRLYPVLREVATDNAISTMLAALFRNMGVPGVLISPADANTTVGETLATAMKSQWKARYSGDGAGEPHVASVPVRVERLAWSPNELSTERVGVRPQARICGALRIPGQVVGLKAGDDARSFANYPEARKAAYQDCIMPILRRFATTLDCQLLSELGDAEREECGWDYSRVAALQEAVTEVFRQNSLGVRGGWMTVNEARSRARLPVLAGEDGFLRGGAGSPGGGDGTTLPQASDGSSGEGATVTSGG